MSPFPFLFCLVLSQFFRPRCTSHVNARSTCHPGLFLTSRNCRFLAISQAPTKAQATRLIAQMAVCNRLQAKRLPDKPTRNGIDPSSITYQILTTKDASIVILTSRLLEKELTITPVRKPEAEKATTSSVSCVVTKRVSYLIGVTRRNSHPVHPTKSGTSIHLHNTTPAVRTHVTLTANLIWFVGTIAIVSPHRRRR
jgi:hypothetical protein